MPAGKPGGVHMAEKKSSGQRKYSKKAGESVESAMHRKKSGTLRSGSNRN